MQALTNAMRRLRPLFAAVAMVLLPFFVLDKLVDLVLANYSDRAGSHYYWESIDSVARRVAALESLETQGKLEPDQLGVVIGQSSVREGFEPDWLQANDPLKRRWAVLGATGGEMRLLEATCLPLGRSQVKADTIVIALDPFYLKEERPPGYIPGPAVRTAVKAFRERRFQKGALSILDQCVLWRLRKHFASVRQAEMFQARLCLSNLFGWPLSYTYAPKDPWTVVNHWGRESAEYGIQMRAMVASHLTRVRFKDCLPRIEALRRTIERLRDRGQTVVVMYAPERSDLRRLVIPEVDILFGRVLAEIGRDKPIPILDFRDAIPDKHFNTRSHLDNKGRWMLSCLLPKSLEGIGGLSASTPDTSHYAPPQIRITRPLSMQVVQQSVGETTVLVGAQSVDTLTSARLFWRRSGDDVFSAGQELKVTSGQECQGRVTLPGPGWYDLEIRAVRLDNGTELVDQCHFGVGEVFLIAGGKSVANLSRSRHRATDNVVAWQGGTWTVANDPQLMAWGLGGSPWPMFGERISQIAQAPVGLINISVKEMNVSDWEPGTVLYDYLRRGLAAAGSNGVRAILWGKGSPNPNRAPLSKESRWKLHGIAESFMADTDCQAPWLVLDRRPRSTKDDEASVIGGDPTAATRPKSTKDDEARVMATAVVRGSNVIIVRSTGISEESNKPGEFVHAMAWARAVEKLQILPNTVKLGQQ